MLRCWRGLLPILDGYPSSSLREENVRVTVHGQRKTPTRGLYLARGRRHVIEPASEWRIKACRHIFIRVAARSMNFMRGIALLSDAARVTGQYSIDLFSAEASVLCQERRVHRSQDQIEAEDAHGSTVAPTSIGASLAFSPEGTALKRLSTGYLSPIEKEVIAEIRELRTLAGSGLFTTPLESPARIVHHFILSSHGNVQLRMATIAREIGVEMRTLERAFSVEFNRTMAQHQIEARLAFCRWTLSIFPPTKISAVAAALGYNRVQDFNRFFKKHMHESPSEWGRRERAKIERDRKRASHD
jgi:AraC-like DNA-binding protein